MVRCGFARQGKSLWCAREKVLWYELLKGVKKSQGQNILFFLGLVFLCFALFWERKLNLYARLSRGDLTANLSTSGVKFCYQFTERDSDYAEKHWLWHVNILTQEQLATVMGGGCVVTGLLQCHTSPPAHAEQDWFLTERGSKMLL